MSDERERADDEVYCPECGKATPRSGVVCGYCGSRIHADVTTPSEIEARARDRLENRPLDPINAARTLGLAWRLWQYDRRTAASLAFNAVGMLGLWIGGAIGLGFLFFG